MSDALKPPAVAIFAISLFTFVSLLMDFDKILNGQMTQFSDPAIVKVASFFGWASLLAQPIALAGAASMLQHKREGLCNIAAAIACVPCLGSCYAFPFGIWAITVLARPDVKELFRQRRRGW